MHPIGSPFCFRVIVTSRLSHVIPVFLYSCTPSTIALLARKGSSAQHRLPLWLQSRMRPDWFVSNGFAVHVKVTCFVFLQCLRQFVITQWASTICHLLLSLSLCLPLLLMSICLSPSQLQFFIVTIHTTYNLFADCDFPDSMNVVVLAYALSLIALFSNFYYRTYLAKKTKKTWGERDGRRALTIVLWRRREELRWKDLDGNRAMPWKAANERWQREKKLFIHCCYVNCLC